MKGTGLFLLDGFRFLRVLGQEGVYLPLRSLGFPAPLAFLLRVMTGIPARSAGDREQGERLAAAFVRLGPAWVKLGQVISVRPDLAGEEIAGAMSRLRDDIPPFPFAVVRDIIHAELGKPAEELFADLDPVPVAAASVAQVHRATTPGGECVAVKILRPGIDRHFQDNLAWLARAAGILERNSAEARRLRLVDNIDFLSRAARIELDLRFEAAAACSLAGQDNPLCLIPGILHRLSGRRVMTMAFIEGIRIGDREALVRAGHDPSVLAGLVIRNFLTQALMHGFFHADPHQGNWLVTGDGRLASLDFGLVGHLGLPDRFFLAETLAAVLRGDWDRAARAHFRAGYVPATESQAAFALALRAVCEPILGRPNDEISIAGILGQLLLISRVFRMQGQPHLFLLQKTMVAVEGVARELEPGIDFWAASRPVIDAWYRERGDILSGLQGRIEAETGRAATLMAQAGELFRNLHRTSGRSHEGGEPGQDRLFWAILGGALLIALSLHL